MRRRIGKPEVKVSTGMGRNKNSTDQLHDGTASALNIDTMIAENADKACLTSDGGKMNVRSVVGHDRLELVQALEQHPIELAREDGGISRNERFTLTRRE